MAALIDRADPNDPIARQFVPDPAELDVQSEERADPIGDDAHSPVEGIVHRYPDRVLLKLTHVCAVYCRFCFRREMVGPAAEPLTAQSARRRARLYRGASGDLGGRADRRRSAGALGAPAQAGGVAARRHRARQDHPRCTPACRSPTPRASRRELVRALKAKGKATYVVLHANHARELTDAAREACARLIDAGIPMLSQSVLLAGVNDDPQTLGELMRALGRMPHQAVLPASRRSRARHVAPAHLDRARPGTDAGVARPAVRPVPADLRARHSRRPRQVADRPELSVAGRGRAQPGSRTSTADRIAIRRLSAGRLKRNTARRWPRASSR